jgi:hypothetical protein
MLPRRSRPSARGVAVAILAVAALLVPVVYLAVQAGAPELVEGFVTGVRPIGPLRVGSFDLLAGDGRTLTFQGGQLDVSNGFDAAHLVVHQVTLQTVVVTYRRDGDRLVAITLADGHTQPTAVPSIPRASAAPPAS